MKPFNSFIFLSLIISNAFGQLNINEKAIKISDSLFSKYDTINSPGLFISIYKENNLLFSEGYGFANIEKNIPITEDTKFQLGTLSDLITAIAIFKLVEADKLKINDTITHILNYLPGYLNKVTVLQLLQHTSGIPVFKNVRNNAVTHVDLDRFIDSQKELENNSGTLFRPNIINYYLLTKIIEKENGKPYWQYINTEIFKPLKISNSYIHNIKKKKIKASNLVNSYSFESGTININNDIKNVKIDGLSNIYMSPADFSNLISVYHGNSFLNKESINELGKIKFSRDVTIYPSVAWKAKFNSGQKYHYLSNTYFGCTHLFVYIPVEKLTIVILSNQYPIFKLMEHAFIFANVFSDKIQFNTFE